MINVSVGRFTTHEGKTLFRLLQESSQTFGRKIDIRVENMSRSFLQELAESRLIVKSYPGQAPKHF